MDEDDELQLQLDLATALGAGRRARHVSAVFDALHSRSRQRRRRDWRPAKPVLVYTFVYAERFAEKLSELRAFLHRMGRETRQGEVAFDFDGEFYRLRKFDER